MVVFYGYITWGHNKFFIAKYGPFSPPPPHEGASLLHPNYPKHPFTSLTQNYTDSGAILVSRYFLFNIIQYFLIEATKACLLPNLAIYFVSACLEIH